MSAKTERLKRAQRMERAQHHRPSFQRRRAVLLALMGIAFASAMASAFYRQVLETDFLQYQGELRSVREREIPARRGMVMDRHGEPLAISTAVATLSADPRLLRERADAIAPLALALDLEPAELAARLRKHQDKAFMYLRRRVEPSVAEAAEEVARRYDIDGVRVETEYRRFYPGGEVFAHILGFTNIDDEGQEGVELAYNQRLRAIPGKRRVLQDGRGRVVKEIEQIASPRNGEDLELSLDRRLQFLTYRELKRAMQQHQANSATAVLLDVATGEILAVASQPSYNPNGARTETAGARKNRVFTDVFEPGSTVKPLVIAMALENGVISALTPVNTNPGYMQVGHHRVRDVHNYGLLNTTGVITKSSNVGIVKIAQQMDRALLWQLYDGVGFGHLARTADDEKPFPGAGSGYLPNFQQWSDFEHATLAFGYGLNVTTAQLAAAYAVLAGDGLMRPLTLLKRDSSPASTRVFSTETARSVRDMLETVVSPQGTARLAAVTGYRIAGKTGTAKKVGVHGYAAGLYQAVFAGMAPASAPRFVMVVMVDEPHGKQYYGGLVAAPVFSKVMEMALRLYNVPPDDPAAPLLLTTSLDQSLGAAR